MKALKIKKSLKEKAFWRWIEKENWNSEVDNKSKANKLDDFVTDSESQKDSFLAWSSLRCFAKEKRENRLSWEGAKWNLRERRKTKSIFQFSSVLWA